MMNHENRMVCNCMQVSLFAIQDVLHHAETFTDVEKAFSAVQEQTHCSTGCGGCHDEIMSIISDMMYQKKV